MRIEAVQQPLYESGIMLLGCLHARFIIDIIGRLTTQSKE